MDVLLRQQAEAGSGYKPKTTIQDLLERFNGEILTEPDQQHACIYKCTSPLLLPLPFPHVPHGGKLYKWKGESKCLPVACMNPYTSSLFVNQPSNMLTYPHVAMPR